MFSFRRRGIQSHHKIPFEASPFVIFPLTLIKMHIGQAATPFSKMSTSAQCTCVVQSWEGGTFDTPLALVVMLRNGLDVGTLDLSKAQASVVLRRIVHNHT